MEATPTRNHARKSTGTRAFTNQPVPSSSTSTSTPPVSASPRKARKSIARNGSAPIGRDTNQSASVIDSTVSQTPVTKRNQARKSTGARKPIPDDSSVATQKKKGRSRHYSNESSSADTQDTTAILTQSRDAHSSDSETEIKCTRRMSRLSFATTTQSVPSTSGLSRPGTSSRRSSDSDTGIKSTKRLSTLSFATATQSVPSTSRQSQPGTSSRRSLSDSDDVAESVKQRQVLKRKSRKLNISSSEGSDAEYVPPDQNRKKDKSSLPTPIQNASVSSTQEESRKTKAMKFNSSFHATNEAGRPLSQGNILNNLVNKCVFYILVADQKKHAIKKPEIMKHVFENQNSKLYPNVLDRVNDVLKKTFGLEILEINNQKNSYILINILDKDHDLGIRDFAEYSPLERQKQGFIFFLLTIIFMNENAITEEELWKSLEPLGISSNSRVPHPIFGDVKKFLTVELVKQMYLEYKCISKDPPQHEFVWGARAIQEVSKEDILEFACKMMGTGKPQDWIMQYNDAKAKPGDAEN